MIKIIAIFALVCLSFQILLPVTKSNLQTKILPHPDYIDPLFTVALNNGQLNNFGLEAYGAKRIMPLDYVATLSPDVTYQVIFGYGCQVPATLFISSVGKFKARVNGGPLMIGDDSNAVFNFSIPNLNCQKNVLNVTVTHFHGSSSLIFAMVYESDNCQHNCFTIGTIGLVHWDPLKCKCVCSLKPSTCPSIYGKKIWSDYPICGCTCKNEIVCQEGRYFDSTQCKCKCLPISCNAGFIQDPYSCSCKSTSLCQNPVVCTGLKDFSWDNCQCMCRETSICTYPFVPDQNCGCYCPSWNMLCNTISLPEGPQIPG